MGRDERLCSRTEGALARNLEEPSPTLKIIILGFPGRKSPHYPASAQLPQRDRLPIVRWRGMLRQAPVDRRLGEVLPLFLGEPLDVPCKCLSHAGGGESGAMRVQEPTRSLLQWRSI